LNYPRPCPTFFRNTELIFVVISSLVFQKCYGSNNTVLFSCIVLFSFAGLVHIYFDGSFISAAIGELEATKLQHESVIADLEKGLEHLKDKVSWLESCKKDLESKTQELSQDQKTQLKSLQQVTNRLKTDMC